MPCDACLNCAQPLPEPRPRFCPACGQETKLRPPTLAEFVQQFGGAWFATEGALWRTLKLLLLRPGELTRQYLAGRRRHYVLPLRLYLSVSLVVLLLLRLAAGQASDAGHPAVQVDSGDNAGLQLELGPGRVGLKDGVFYCEHLPGWVCARLQRRLDGDARTLAREMGQVGERLVGNLGAAMFVLLPGFALWLKLAWLNRRLRYTEHLVFALHLHSFWFLALALMLPELPGLSALAMLALPAYALAALKRVYGGRWWPLLLRAAFVSALYALSLVPVLSVLGLWSLLA